MVVARALWLEPSPSFLEERRRLGLDHFDEVWEGVLHLLPPPSFHHNKRQQGICRFLEDAIQARDLGEVVLVTGVRPPGSGTTNYRVPDVSVIPDDSVVNDGWIEAGPPLVVEVRSPGDESYEKMPFYAEMGVHELLIVERDSGQPELYRLAGKSFVAVSPDAEGWLVSDRFPVAFRPGPGGFLDAMDGTDSTVRSIRG